MQTPLWLLLVLFIIAINSPLNVIKNHLDWDVVDIVKSKVPKNPFGNIFNMG